MLNFPKSERLCHRSEITETLQKGKHFYLPEGLRICYQFTPIEFSKTGETLQILISVPKRYTKKAVDRNRKKRHFREAFRKQKSPFITFLKERGLSMNLALFYQHSTFPSASDASLLMQKIFDTLEKKMN